MPVCHRRKLIFLHIPRCGGTSITEALGLTTKQQLVGIQRIGDQPLTLHHLTLPDLVTTGLLSEETVETYFTFTVVRDPFDRLVSDYFWQLSHDPKKRFAELTFSEFIAFAAHVVREQRYFDEKHFDHFRPTADYCLHDQALVVDDILLVESLQEGLKTLEPFTGPLEAPNINSSRINQQVSHLEEMRPRVYDLYAEDLILYKSVKRLSTEP